MAILDEKTKNKVKEILSKGMKEPVTLHIFTQEFECEYCKETREIAQELSALDNRIKVQTYDFIADAEKAKQMGIERIPAVVVDGGGYNVRYYGIPSGYEFSSLLEDIVDASQRKTRLSPELVEKIKGISKPVHIKVFVTPTCPYCPRAVRTAHQFAMLNSNIIADMIEAVEFPELSEKYEVMAVPKVVINEKVTFEGALPEAEFAEQVMEALD
jgi:glutaredoxin-like protein